ncbi:MAG: LysM peptidoglycan-binding domain-containing protein [Armatimonadetes bacterium]|nr:LysM peptidoglycan-binding domain-containing protein [Anaerolineae bacterium]
MPRHLVWIILTALLTLNSVSGISAQQNLLQDPSFETTETYKRVGIDPLDNTTYFDVPPAWSGWIGPRAASDPESQNRVPTGFPHTALFKIDQNRSFHISRGYATFTVATYQSVTVPDKANVRGSARGFMERGTEGSPTPGGQFRVGIDPNGGGNPLDGGIIWSSWVTSDDGWQQAIVDATAISTRVTLFLYATQSVPDNPNGIYWDDASLVVGGGGGTSTGGTPGATALPPVPTPPPFANFVAPQPPQDTGQIIHIVRDGDTMAAIAVAYSTTIDEILALNGLNSGRFIFPGQSLIIRLAPPGGGASSAEIADEEANATEDLAATEDPTATEASAATEDTRAGATSTPAPTTTAASDTAQTEELAPAVTNTPVATATDALPAPVTQVAERNQSVSGVCLLMFDDANQNRIREQDEGLVAQGTITLSANGATVQTYNTDGSSEPFCVPQLAAGVYTAAAQPPDGYGLTTSPQLSLRVQTGIAVNASFGAAQGVAAVAPPPADTAPQAAIVEVAETATVNPLLQNIGLVLFGAAGVVLVLGLGAALLLRRQ